VKVEEGAGGRRVVGGTGVSFISAFMKDIEEKTGRHT
jgi:hypothetical protein